MQKYIAGHELVLGKTVKDYIRVEGTELLVPYVLICGKEDGPAVLVTAGIHSAEFVGIEAAIELSNELKPEELRGSVAIVPLANRSGFEHRTMSMVYEDGKNLNRVFPGSAEGSAAEKLAFTLFETFITHADAYIDLHSGDGYETLHPFVYYLGDTSAENDAKRMASCVNTDYCVRSRCRTGGAYNLASLRGIPSVLIERGRLSLFPREEIDADKEDVRNILRMLGVLRGEHKTYAKTELLEYNDIAPATGCWYPEKRVGESFKESERFGVIRDYFGETIHAAVASRDGVILYQCSSLNIIEKGPMVAYGVKTGHII